MQKKRKNIFMSWQKRDAHSQRVFVMKKNFITVQLNYEEKKV